MKRWVGFLSFSIALLVFSPAWGLVETLDVGTFNWETFQVTSSGFGEGASSEAVLGQVRKAAQKKAETLAYQNLLATLSFIPVTGEKSLGHLMSQSSEIKAEAERLARAFIIHETIHYSDGGVRLHVSVSFTPLLKKVFGREVNTEAPIQWPKTGEARYTGLVVVAKGLPFSPVLAPRIIAEDGSLIFSTDVLAAAVLNQPPVVNYVQSVEAAHGLQRLGKTPLVLQAIRIDHRDTLVVPSNEVRTLLAGQIKRNFLEEGRLAIVLSGP